MTILTDELAAELRLEGIRILQGLQQQAKAMGIPQAVVELDMATYATAFRLDDDGDLVLASDPTKSAKTALLEWRRDRPHWEPENAGESGKTTDTPAPRNEKQKFSVGDCFLENANRIEEATGDRKSAGKEKNAGSIGNAFTAGYPDCR